MANRITVKCDGVEEEKSLSTNVDTIFKLRQLLQKEHFKKYPVVLYKEKKVPKLSDPIPMDGNNELLHFISKIDIEDPKGKKVSHELTKTVAEVMEGHTRQDFKCVLITGSEMKIEKSDDKLKKIYKPGRVLKLKVFKSAKYKCRIEPMTLDIVKVEIDKEGTVKDLVNEALKMYNHKEFDIKCSDFDPYQHIEVTKGLELVGLEAKLDTLNEDTEVYISYNYIPDEKEKIETMKRYTKSPSDYGKENKWRNFQLTFRKVPICDHREGRVGDDVTLYYPEFQQFIDNCNGMIKPSKSDFCFAKKVCDEMSKYFSSEKERENAFAKEIKEYLKQELGKNDVVQSESGQSVADIVINPNSCVIMEVKNESGQGGGSDSHSQIIAYYVQSLEEKKPDQCPAPAYLIELVGPQLTISGAVFGKYVFVDKLIDPVWLVPQHNEEAIFKIARIFKALKEAIGKIRQYYENATPVIQPRFPIFKSFDKGDIQYEEAIKSHTYEGTLTYYGETEPVNVIIKFVKQYSHEAHQFMHSKGYAPELIFYPEGVNGTRYKAIVTKKIDFSHHGYNISEEDKNDYHNKLKTAVTTLYNGGFCHGNLLPKHIVYDTVSKRIYILNYEWAIKQDDKEYPLLEHPKSKEEMELLNKLLQ